MIAMKNDSSTDRRSRETHSDRGSRAALVPLSESHLTLSNPSRDVHGRKVLDQKNNEIGDVDDLLVDEKEALVRFLKVKSGGFLGLGAETVFIPVDAVTHLNDTTVWISQTREQVSGAPRYDPELTEREDYYANLYGYYGYTPFWGPGYMYPPFPYYGPRMI
jgi:sporulation protein YlmC with PRC-barrel domain